MPSYASTISISSFIFITTFKNVKDKVILERCPWSSKNIFTNMLVQNGHINEIEYNLYCNFYDKVALIYLYI